ncbi:MAG: hypothetical protein WD431_23805 [Cyclobacteriaceae bacterium]
MKLLVLLAFLMAKFQTHFPEWQKVQENYDPGEIILMDKRVIGFMDSLLNDTLYIGKLSQNQQPVVFRELNTGVCEDKVCLPVDLYMFWSFSGNYIGIRPIKPLTKNKHDPFLETDYLKLHRLLKDPQSLLANYALADLTGKEPDNPSVDGVSAATHKDIQGYIIDGAAYTTHTLWHIAYGPVRDSVRMISTEYVDEEIMNKYLNSPNRQDNIWALNRFRENALNFIERIPDVRTVMTGNDPNLSRIAMESVVHSDLEKERIQMILLEAYLEADFNTKRGMIDYFKSIDVWYFSSVLKIIQIISTGENNGLNDILFGLLRDKSRMDSLTRENIHHLLRTENKSQKQLSIKYLKEMGIKKKVW